MSFKAILHVSGQNIVLDYVDLDLNQSVDARSRPASLTRGGTITVEFDTPSDGDMIADWAANPVKQLDGSITYMNQNQDSVMKTINFYNAYCIEFMERFDGSMSSSNMKTTIKISPERVNIGGVEHDNNWFVHGTSKGAGAKAVTSSSGIATKEGTEFEKGTVVESKKKEPGLFSDILHGVLDVAGMVPVIGEVADGINALAYLAEGNTTDAALSAAAMIPIAGWGATGVKAIRKGSKIVDAVKAGEKVKDGVKALDTASDGVKAIDNVSEGTRALAPKVKKRGPDGLTASERRRVKEKNGQKSRQSEYPHGNKKKQDAYIESQRGPDGKLRDIDGNVIEGKVTIEHNKPVAEHWNEKGRNQTREERAEFYNDESNWSLKGDAENKSGGSKVKRDTGGYKQETGPNYTAKRAKKPKK
jgi:Hemolysin coregulated protein Hcp (TssD)